ncbi:MAG TPA: type II toxin-antitoxin system VapC family toxin [Gammaproteobacteria bacterium]|nr:type II toxin-antitoxin system VapC family toxin [Gammaproteobacteria bacterium]
MRTYIDTSILGAYYCPEPSSAAAETALRSIGEPVISSLTEVEFCSLVAKKYRLGEFGESKARKILEAFTAHVADGYYHRLALTAEHYTRARSLVGALGTTLHPLDALHLALALTQKLPLLTADSILAAAARRHKVKTTLVK